MRLFRSSNCSLQRLARLAGRRLGEQLLGRGGARAGGQLLGQVVGQLRRTPSLAATGALSHRSSTIAPTPLVPIGMQTDPAERGLAPDAALLHLDAVLAQPLDGRLLVAAGVLQGLLAVHHRQAGLLAQRLDGRRGNFCHG